MPRAMEIVTPLGEDVLLFHAMHAREELGRLGEYRLDLLSTRSDIDLDEILGKNVTVKLALPDDSTRFFNGYVTRFAQGGSRGRYHCYSAVVHPWLWFLTQTADCRIFQDMTVPDIVRQVFGDHPTADFALDLTGDYRTRPYCVQYRETDFNFVSRLLEEEGISYYVRHTEGHDKVVLTDSTSKHTASPGYETIPFVSPGQVVRPELEHINEWAFSRQVQPGVYVHDDYDLERPSVELRTRKALPRGYTPSDYEVYDYPGNYLQKPHGEQYAGVRVDEFGSQFETAESATNSKGVRVGALFTLEDCPREDQNREYLIVAATYDLHFSDYEAMPEGTGTGYQCRFTAMPSNQQFRPPRVTPKPFVQGPQTAVVVGPAGEEIYTDRYGRVKVQFHWDRYGTKDENSSCWIRVGQTWAGKNWGGIQIPRIGQEVIVDFLEGDPDQPIVTGRVYNAEQMPPYDLPANKTQSGVKSRSTLNGGAANFNEIRFEDEKGKEHIVIHAERNLNILAEVNERQTIGNNTTLTLGTNPHGNPRQNGKLTTTIFGDTGITITKGDLSLDVQTGKMTVHVKGPVEETFDDTLTTTVATQIKLVCGASSLTMKKDGTIEINGKDIKIKGSASVEVDSAKIDSEATGTHTMKGAKVEISGSSSVAVYGTTIESVAKTTHTIKGALVKINC